MNTQQRIMLDEMFSEVRETFDSIIGNFYEDQGINLEDVNIEDEEYMDNLVDEALQNYSNSEEYTDTFTDMRLWDDIRNKTTAFGVAIHYITISCNDRCGDYNIPADYFIEPNHNRLRLLFQYSYLSENRDIVKQTLIDVYNTHNNEDENEDEDEDEIANQ
jgi:hypothetical protein